MYRHLRQSCKIANSEEGMEKLFEHTLQRQVQEVADLKSQVAAQTAQMDRLSELLERQLIAAPHGADAPPRPAGMHVERANQVNTGPVINVQQNIVAISPWDGEKRIEVGLAQIAAAFAENARLKEYARWPDRLLSDPELAPPYVTELLMDLVKRGHADPAARNVYLNPRRADQVLVHMRAGQWEVLPLAEATRLLFDGVAQTVHQLVMTYAELKQLPLEAQNALSMAGMLYEDEPDEYARRAKSQMVAHLANTAPRPLGQ